MTNLEIALIIITLILSLASIVVFLKMFSTNKTINQEKLPDITPVTQRKESKEAIKPVWITSEKEGEKLPFSPEFESARMNLRSVSPYHVIVENKTDEPKKAVILGFSKYWNNKNYGSDAGIEISSMYGDYFELLSESAFQPFDTEIIRLQAKNRSQFKNEISFFYRKASGCSYSMPMYVPREDYATDARNQKEVLDLNLHDKAIPFNASTYMEVMLDPNERLMFTFFPKSQISLDSLLNNDTNTETYQNLYGQDLEETQESIERKKEEEKRRIEWDRKVAKKFDEKLAKELIDQKERERTRKHEKKQDESLEVNADNVDEIKDSAPSEELSLKEAGIEISEELDALENFFGDEELSIKGAPSPMQMKIKNKTNTDVSVKGNNLWDSNLSSMIDLEIMGVDGVMKDAKLSLVRIFAQGSVSDSVLSYVDNKGVDLFKKYNTNPEIKTLVDIPTSNLISELFLIIKPNKEVTVTFFQSEVNNEK